MTIGEQNNLELLFQRFEDKSSKGSGFATMYLADCFLYGWGTGVDYGEYKKYLNQAAVMGVDVACERILFEALSKEDVVETNRILEIWKKNAETDYFSSYKDLYNRYSSIEKKDVQSIILALKNKNEFIESGYEDRQLAVFYQFGFGIEKDIKKALEYYIKAFEKTKSDEFIAATIVGINELANNEERIPDDVIQLANGLNALDTIDSKSNPIGYIEKLILFAACNGNVESQAQMAELYLGGDDCLLKNNIYVNYSEAVRWLIVSLKNGGDVSNELLWLADKLQGINDQKNAFLAFEALAADGIVIAISILGTYYWKGEVIPKDIKKAADLWLIAAQHGDETAINNVNIINEAGNGDFDAGIKALIDEDNYRKNADYDNNNNTPTRQQQSSGGCYIATCVYGSYDCPEVWTLRRYRDFQLSKSWYGRLFIKIYYALSPIIVRWFGKYDLFKDICRKPLNKMVNNLIKNGYKTTRYKDKNWN